MEVLAPLDHRQFSNHADWFPRHPRLASDLTKMKPTDMLSFRSEADRPIPSYEVSQAGSGSRQSPRQIAALPPIGTAKPSLPPIRSLLAEPLGSPPATPPTVRTHNPHEYTHHHKRSSSTLAWERRSSTHASPASVHSASLPSIDSYRHDSVAQSVHDLGSYRQPDDPYARHRAYLPELRNPNYDSRPISPERHRLPEATQQRKRSYDSMSGPIERERLMPPSPWSRGPAPGPSYHAASPPPPSGFRPYPASGTPMGRPHMIDGRGMGAPMHQAMHMGSPAPAMYQRPGVYDYHLSKSRKRSNLPKESTDIMKRWFEAHLDNPYPSEEDKKHFAAEAGINLTQVSNWFINHRRRCPELREQRDKKQTTGGRTATSSP